MPRETTPPSALPTSKTTTSIFNALSLRNNQQTALLSTLGTFKPSASNPRRPRPQEEDEDVENEVYDANLGVGVRDGKQKARELNQEQEALRSKMFGRKRKEEELRRYREGSSEEEEGRGAVGRRKKVKKRARDSEEEEDRNNSQATAETKDEIFGEGDNGEKKAEPSQLQGEPTKKKKKRNKNKKKRKESE